MEMPERMRFLVPPRYSAASGKCEFRVAEYHKLLQDLSFKNGVQCEDAAISLVWSAAAFLEAHGAVGRARAMVSIGDLEPAGAMMSALAH
jgi:hypothetical protein